MEAHVTIFDHKNHLFNLRRESILRRFTPNGESREAARKRSAEKDLLERAFLDQKSAWLNDLKGVITLKEQALKNAPLAVLSPPEKMKPLRMGLTIAKELRDEVEAFDRPFPVILAVHEIPALRLRYLYMDKQDKLDFWHAL